MLSGDVGDVVVLLWVVGEKGAELLLLMLLLFLTASGG